MKDPYVQSETGTLINRLNISDYEELQNAEKDIVASKLLNVGSKFCTKFDIGDVKNIHKHLFEDIFDWAGEFRTVPIEKEEKYVIPGLSLTYSLPENIEKELSKCLENMNSINWESMPLEEKSKIFTENLTNIWIIHPFRDGNTRTTLSFATIFAREHGFPMNIGILLDQLARKRDSKGNLHYSIRDKFVLSALPKEFSPEPQYLNAMIYKSMVSGINSSIEELKNELTNVDAKDCEER